MTWPHGGNICTGGGTTLGLDGGRPTRHHRRMISLPLCWLALAVAQSVAGGQATSQSAPVDAIVSERLHDHVIQIDSTQCFDFTGCRTYQISLDRNGRGEMRFDRDGVAQVRGFIMTPYAFCKLQFILEPLRPAPGNSETHDGCLDGCDTDYEITKVSWTSDQLTTRRFVRERSAHEYDILDQTLIKAQNMLLAMLAPSRLPVD